MSGLRFTGITYMEASASTMPSAPLSANYLHPGKAAEIKINGQVVGVFGELHPLVKEGYVLGDASVLVAEFDLETLRRISPAYGIVPVSELPPVYEDIAIIVNDSVAASTVEALIRETGGKTVTNVKLLQELAQKLHSSHRSETK